MENVLQKINDSAIESAKNYIQTNKLVIDHEVFSLLDSSNIRIFKLEFNNYLYSQGIKFKL